MGPSWHQIASKIDPKNDQKINHILDRFRTNFWWILASNLAPIWGVLTFGFWSILALGALLGPRWAQDLSKRPSKTDFGGFWDPTWWILGPNLHDSATALVPKGAWPFAEGT